MSIVQNLDIEADILKRKLDWKSAFLLRVVDERHEINITTSGQRLSASLGRTVILVVFDQFRTLLVGCRLDAILLLFRLSHHKRL